MSSWLAACTDSMMSFTCHITTDYVCTAESPGVTIGTIKLVQIDVTNIINSKHNVIFHWNIYFVFMPWGKSIFNPLNSMIYLLAKVFYCFYDVLSVIILMLNKLFKLSNNAAQSKRIFRVLQWTSYVIIVVSNNECPKRISSFMLLCLLIDDVIFPKAYSILHNVYETLYT